jgi:hypothetical protein
MFLRVCMCVRVQFLLFATWQFYQGERFDSNH